MALAGRKPDQEWLDTGHRHASASATACATGPSELSGGQQQRVACARALASRPDRSSSPTSRPATSTRKPAPRSSTFMRDGGATSSGQTIVMVTHDPAAAGVRRPGRLPRRRPHRRRDAPTRRPTRVLDRMKNVRAPAEAVATVLRVTLKSLLARKLRLLLTALVGGPRRGVRRRHLRAHRHAQARRSTTCSSPLTAAPMSAYAARPPSTSASRTAATPPSLGHRSGERARTDQGR